MIVFLALATLLSLPPDVVYRIPPTMIMTTLNVPIAINRKLMPVDITVHRSVVVHGLPVAVSTTAPLVQAADAKPLTATVRKAEIAATIDPVFAVLLTIFFI
jgi:hypothetical protein